MSLEAFLKARADARPFGIEDREVDHVAQAPVLGNEVPTKRSFLDSAQGQDRCVRPQASIPNRRLFREKSGR
ncbi:hypothetical protein BH09GEM1_BH09GEM1_33120 [soil metagenome]